MTSSSSAASLRRACMQLYQQTPPVDNDGMCALLSALGLGENREYVALRMKVRNSNDRLTGVAIPFEQVLTMVEQCAKNHVDQLETAELRDAWMALGGQPTEESMSATQVASFLQAFGLNPSVVLRGTAAASLRRSTIISKRPPRVTNVVPSASPWSSSDQTSGDGGHSGGFGAPEEKFRFADLQDLVAGGGNGPPVEEVESEDSPGSANAAQAAAAAVAAAATPTDDAFSGPKTAMSFAVLTMVRKYVQRFRARLDARMKSAAHAAELSRYQAKYFPPKLVFAEHRRQLKSPNKKSILPPLVQPDAEQFDRVVHQHELNEQRKRADERRKALLAIHQRCPRSDGQLNVSLEYARRPIVSPLALRRDASKRAQDERKRGASRQGSTSQ